MTLALPEIDSLSLEQQVAQLFVVRASGHLFDHQIEYPAWEPPISQLQQWLEMGIGGAILLGGSAGEVAWRSRQLQSLARYPLLVAADIEEGVGQRFVGATWFPPPMALGAIAEGDLSRACQYAERMGAVTAQEALAIGINWILAPVVDVNNNPDNPVINVRSFGQTPETVCELSAAFIRGVRQFRALSCAKHFPGHGDTGVDSHLELPVIPHDSDRLAEVELPPFVNAIAAGVDSVMSAHLLIRTWDEEFPATLSRPILTGQLRQKLGFEGVIVTDALVMGAIANRYGAAEAPILALEAGADILLMPVDPPGAIQAVCEAVESGRISRDRVRQSVERIFALKRKTCQDQPEVSPLSLTQPDALQTAADILRDSMRVGGNLPLQLDSPPDEDGYRNLIIVDDLLGCDFLAHHTPAIARPERLGYRLQLIDSHTDLNPVAVATDTFSPTLLQLFIRGNPFRGSAGLTQAARDWLQRLLKTGELQALVIYGSPYILEQSFLKLPPHVPYVFSYGQTSQAQAIALDTLFSRGELTA